MHCSHKHERLHDGAGSPGNIVCNLQVEPALARDCLDTAAVLTLKRPDSWGRTSAEHIANQSTNLVAWQQRSARMPSLGCHLDDLTRVSPCVTLLHRFCTRIT